MPGPVWSLGWTNYAAFFKSCGHPSSPELSFPMERANTPQFPRAAHSRDNCFNDRATGANDFLYHWMLWTTMLARGVVRCEKLNGVKSLRSR